MKRYSIIILLLVFVPLVISAQKKELSQAKTYLKSGKNFDKAELLMRNLLKDSANREQKKIYLTLFEAIRKQYEQGNEKLYLKQKFDTANLFMHARDMFLVLESLDSLDMQPDSKGRVKLEYRDRHAAYLSQYRGNIFNGGNFFLNKAQYQKAYDMFDLYVESAHQPLFEGMHYDSLDVRLPQAAYYALLCGYKQNNSEQMLKHVQLAKKDSLHLSYVLQYMADIYHSQRDTLNYVRCLKEGFAHDPEFSFFYPRLLDYYCLHNQFDSAMVVADRLLERNDSNEMYLFARSSILLNQGKYAECIDICRSLIERNDSFPDAFYQIGLAYVNLAVETERVSKSRTKRAQVKKFYQQAKPYMETYRKMVPDRKDLWAPVLYNIYLNLNMGKEFDEMDRLLK